MVRRRRRSGEQTRNHARERCNEERLHLPRVETVSMRAIVTCRVGDGNAPGSGGSEKRPRSDTPRCARLVNNGFPETLLLGVLVSWREPCRPTPVVRGGAAGV